MFILILGRGTETSVALFKPSGDDVIRLGSLVKLVCNFQGHPKPEVTWLKDGSEVVPSDNVELNGDILTVKSLTHDDCGSYMCRVDEIYQERPYIVDVPNGECVASGATLLLLFLLFLKACYWRYLFQFHSTSVFFYRVPGSRQMRSDFGVKFEVISQCCVEG